MNTPMLFLIELQPYTVPNYDKNIMSYRKSPALQDFDVEKYAELEYFSPEQWASLIESRLRIAEILTLSNASYAKADASLVRLIRQWLDETDDSKSIEYFEQFQKYFGPDHVDVDSAIDSFRNSITAAAFDRFWEYPLKPLNKIVLGFTSSLKKLEQRAVKPLNGVTVLALQRAIVEVRKNNPDSEIADVDGEISYDNWDKNLDCSIDQIIEESESYKIRHFANLTVDLRKSDPEIFEEFKLVLAEYRKSLKIKPLTITKIRLDRWFKNNVMPYADLMLWSQWKGVHLSEGDLIDLLYPESDANKPLKGTKEGYSEAFSYLTLVALAKGI
jgi:hypothetical protein